MVTKNTWTMINTKVKGWKVRRQAISDLERAGYLVDTVEKTSKFAKQKDLFGLFDIIGIKKGTAILMQITCNRPHSHQAYKDFSKKYSNNGIECWQFVWYDRKGWIKWNYRFGNAIKYDERKLK
jgi:hypothetical protein